MLVDLAALDKRIEDVKDGVAAPCIGVITQQLGFFAGGLGSGDAIAVATERLKLVNEFVDYVPCPIIL